MKTSCLRHPAKDPYIQVHKWQIDFCEGNHCAGLLLAFFSGWHDWKLEHDAYYSRANDIAEFHGDERPNNQNAYLFFTSEELFDGILGIYGKNSIQKALDYLEGRGVISLHKNPNPRYHFDKTKYFRLYPDVCNDWIDSNQKQEVKSDNKIEKCTLQKSDLDPLELKDPKLKSNQPSHKMGRAITNTTNNTTKTNQSINARDDFNESMVEKEKPDVEVVDVHEANNSNEVVDEVENVIGALLSHGMSKERLSYKDSKTVINKFLLEGAKLPDFIEAFEKSVHFKGFDGFGLNYMVKVLETNLSTKKRQGSSPKPSLVKKPQEFHTFIPKGMDWALDGASV